MLQLQVLNNSWEPQTAVKSRVERDTSLAWPGEGGVLADRFGRTVGYLRLSLTKACAMRCTYCRPAKLVHHHDDTTLSVDEIHAVVEHLASRHGLRKVRLTGGDPTSRADLVRIIERIASISGIDQLAMTTNALTLPRHAKAYAAAGLQRVNISLDSLKPHRFAAMTGVDALPRVLAGIDEAIRVGLKPIRINTVVLKNENDMELPDLVRFAAMRGLEIRFIELMPMGPLASQWQARYVPERRMRQIIEPHVQQWTALPQYADAARRYRVQLTDGGETTIGFITPMSCNFCAACNRIRLAADGTLYPCLMDAPGPSLLPAIRPCFDPDHFDDLLLQGLTGKRSEHPHDGHAVMTHIGG